MRGIRTAFYAAAMAALTAGCSVSVEEGETSSEAAEDSTESGDDVAAQLEQGIVDDYAAREIEVVGVSFAAEEDGVTYSGFAVVIEPNSGEEIEVACRAEPSDDGQYSFDCEE